MVKWLDWVQSACFISSLTLPWFFKSSSKCLVFFALLGFFVSPLCSNWLSFVSWLGFGLVCAFYLAERSFTVLILGPQYEGGRRFKGNIGHLLWSISNVLPVVVLDQHQIFCFTSWRVMSILFLLWLIWKDHSIAIYFKLVIFYSC